MFFFLSHILWALEVCPILHLIDIIITLWRLHQMYAWYWPINYKNPNSRKMKFFGFTLWQFLASIQSGLNLS